jgi:ADP-heptose:LPS heptosyltransferase
MHLACTVGTRVLAIFRARDVARWAPPAQAARIVCGDQTVSAEEVLNAALEELNLEANSLIERAEGALRQTGQA